MLAFQQQQRNVKTAASMKQQPLVFLKKPQGLYFTNGRNICISLVQVLQVKLTMIDQGSPQRPRKGAADDREALETKPTRHLIT